MADDNNTPEPVRPLAITQDKDGNTKATSNTSPEGFKVRGMIHLWPKIVIPVIFVPGVMGTNLKVKGDTAKAWAAPTGTFSKLGALWKYKGQDAATRQAILDPNTTEVDPDGSISVWPQNAGLMHAPGKGKTPKEVAHWRGWGEVHEESYRSILNELEQQLGNMLYEGEPTQYWRDYVLHPSASEFGARKPWQPLTEEEIKKAAKAAYPVHACGYNWLQSNRDSGQHLKARIQEIIDYYQGQGQGHLCDKVILVTHSMGGLASRACVKMAGGEDLILGILHGVMPAIGAPAAYKRMRAGFEGAESVILGRNAAEAAAVLGNAPAGLELLPTAEYFTKIEEKQRPWLRATGKSQDTLLGVGDPYETIYRDQDPQHWWRMIKVELLNPLGRKEEEKEKSGVNKGETEKIAKANPDVVGGDWRIYENILGKAKSFHEELAGKYHPKTFSFYAADAGHKSWNEVQWLTKDAAEVLPEGEIVADDLVGNITVQLPNGPAKFKIQPPKGRGDGTVPEESGEAPLEASIQCFRHEGAAKGHISYEHQYCYDNNLTKGVSLYSIVKLAISSSIFEKE